MSDLEKLQRRVVREKTARQQAEALLEAKSRELYQTNLELQQATEDLEQRVEERTRELASVNQQLESHILERSRTASTLSALYHISQVLTEADSLVGAAPDILESICVSLNMQIGGLWVLDHDQQLLQLVQTHQTRPQAFREFDMASQQTSFSFGVGLPGQAWARKEPMWISDVTHATNFPRAVAAAQAGLHTAFCISGKAQ